MADQRHPGIPAGSRAARIRAGISGVLAEADGAVSEDPVPGAGRVLCELAGVLAAGQGQLDLALARLAARIKETGALAGSGHSTVAGLLRANGRSSSQANAVATVAEHMDHYPGAVKAAEAGRVSFGQLALVMELSERAVAGRCTRRHPDAGDYRAKAEGIMVQAAEAGAGDRALKRIGRELPQRISPQEHEEYNRDAYDGRGLRLEENRFGFGMQAWGDAASAEIIRTAVEAHTAPPDERTPAQRRFDALVQLCENRLAAEGLPVPVPQEGSDAATALNAPRVEQGTRRRGAFRPQVSVVVPLEALLLKEGAAPATTDRGRLLPPSAVRAFASDSIVRR
uniref:DUF222 domain-containing protein n=1 Tax=Nocardiopsis halophila TaxID=141692 RepID=UPI000584CAA1